MDKGWRLIIGVVLVMLVLGGVCIGVGSLTGGDWGRVQDNLNTHYGVDVYVQAYSDYAGELWSYVTGG